MKMKVVPSILKAGGASLLSQNLTYKKFNEFINK
jgi:hypothetical protein